MAPIAELTAAASEIQRTGNPDRTLPAPIADDEVAELSRTLSGMLASLSDARNETETTLERQRAFVADASHELRTPLTSVLANLELLVDSLEGADLEVAPLGAALDPADAPAGRRSAAARPRRCGLCSAARAARPRRHRDRGGQRAGAREPRPRARARCAAHARGGQSRRSPARRDEPDRERAPPHAARHACHRQHAPTARTARRSWSSPTTAPASPRTSCASSCSSASSAARGDRGRLLRPRPRDRRRGRHAGPQRHRRVDESPHGGARFTVRLPPRRSRPSVEPHRPSSDAQASAGAAPGGSRGGAPQTSTTTGSTIGRRLSRS